MLIGIDASTTATGYAFGGMSDAAQRGGCWKLPGADEQVFDKTLARATESVSDLCKMLRAKHVVIEAPLLLVDNRSAHTAMALIQLTGAIRAAARRAGARVTLCAASTVRKHFIGKGNLKSDEAKAAVMARCAELGWPFENDNNRADANAVWAYGMGLHYPAWSVNNSPLFAGRA